VKLTAPAAGACVPSLMSVSRQRAARVGRRRFRAVVIATALLATIPPAPASTPETGGYVIERHAIHSGGTSRASGGDYELSGTAGQPAPGPSSGGGYTLDAGFIWPLRDVPGDGVFRDGFEGS
jgi:hypothetical protein